MWHVADMEMSRAGWVKKEAHDYARLQGFTVQDALIMVRCQINTGMPGHQMSDLDRVVPMEW